MELLLIVALLLRRAISLNKLAVQIKAIKCWEKQQNNSKRIITLIMVTWQRKLNLDNLMITLSFSIVNLLLSKVAKKKSGSIRNSLKMRTSELHIIQEILINNKMDSIVKTL